ncbi:MAG: GntR family transcriptional regulator [Verrucomicrobiota bacterium]
MSEASLSLSTTIYGRLKRDILSHCFEPGQKLKVTNLTERYEAGGSPVREALSRLAADGLVESLENRGFRVPRVTRDDLIELYQTRAWLEEVALTESVRQGGESWETALVLASHRLSKVPRTEDGRPSAKWEEAHRAFHVALISGCGSSWMIKFCSLLHDQADRYRQQALAASTGKRDIIAEHKEIAEAAAMGDAELAVERLLAHYDRTRVIILDSDLLE